MTILDRFLTALAREHLPLAVIERLLAVAEDWTAPPEELPLVASWSARLLGDDPGGASPFLPIALCHGTCHIWAPCPTCRVAHDRCQPHRCAEVIL